MARGGIDILWMGCRDKPELLDGYAKKHFMGDWILDEGDKLVTHFDIKSGAGLVLITKEGRFRGIIDGVFSKRTLHEFLDKAYAFKPEPTP
jgi:hypothetical protein